MNFSCKASPYGAVRRSLTGFYLIMLLLNLLPPKIKQKIKERKELYEFSVLIFKWLYPGALFLLLMLVFYGYMVFVKLNTARDLTEIENTLPRNGQISGETLSEFRKEALSLEAFSKQNIEWSNVLLDLTRIAPQGIRLKFIAIDSGNRVQIEGFSLTREAILELEKSLAGLDYVKDLNFPFSNIIKPTDISFKLSFTYKKN